MLNGVRKQIAFVGLIAVMALTGLSYPVSADRYSDSNFVIDGTTGASFGGTSSSTNYGLVSSGGDAVIGNGASGSYKLGQGFTSQLEQSLLMWSQPDFIDLAFSMELVNGTRIFNNAWNVETANVYSGGVEIPSSGVTSVAGKVGQALSFDGSQSISLGDVQGVEMNKNSTISMWLRPTDFSVRQNPYARDFAGIGAITQEQDGRLNYYYGPDGGEAGPYQVFSTNTALPLNTWTHVAIVRDLTTMKLTWYINGVQDNQTTANYSTITRVSYPTEIAGGYLTDNYRGVIDELKVYYDAVTAANIKAEYNANQQGIATGLGIPEITPGTGTPQHGWLVTFVETDAPRFGIAISQDRDLQSGSSTIPAINVGSIQTPVLWDNGVTKGLGFSAPNGSGVREGDAAKWGDFTSPRFAPVPNTLTTVLTQSGITGDEKWSDYLKVELDVPDDQPAGTYSNTVTLVATIIP